MIIFCRSGLGRDEKGRSELTTAMDGAITKNTEAFFSIAIELVAEGKARVLLAIQVAAN